MHIKLKQFIAKLTGWFKIAYRKTFCLSYSKKKRIIIWSSIGSVLLFAFVLGLLLGSIATIRPRNVGVLFNTVTQRVSTTTTTNAVNFAGLGAYYIHMPNQNAVFQINFGQDSPEDVQANFPSFSARTAQGTKLNISVLVSGTLAISNSNTGYSVFLDKYGLDWTRYLGYAIPSKIRNVVSGLNFYDITSNEIISRLNLTMDEFSMNIVKLDIKLPQQAILANTIGLEQFQKTSIKNFLNLKQTQIQDFTTSTFMTNANTTFTSAGNQTATRDRMIIEATASTAITDKWRLGFGNLSAAFNNGTVNNTAIEIFVWSYVQTYYNATFQRFFNQSNAQIQYQ